MVTWNDKEPYKFLEEWSCHSQKHEINAAAASRRLEFKEVNVNDIIRKSYKLWPKRILMYSRRYQQGREIGTLFCRSIIYKGKQKWFLKDGNHRFLAVIANGEEIVRIAYDPQNKI
jgi:hypothetical protein